LCPYRPYFSYVRSFVIGSMICNGSTSSSLYSPAYKMIVHTQTTDPEQSFFFAYFICVLEHPTSVHRKTSFQNTSHLF